MRCQSVMPQLRLNKNTWQLENVSPDTPKCSMKGLPGILMQGDLNRKRSVPFSELGRICRSAGNVL